MNTDFLDWLQALSQEPFSERPFHAIAMILMGVVLVALVLALVVLWMLVVATLIVELYLFTVRFWHGAPLFRRGTPLVPRLVWHALRSRRPAR